MPFKPRELSLLADPGTSVLYGNGWLPILEHDCDFDSEIFESVTLNLIRNPNINSSYLFRADIIYDSLNGEFTNVEWPVGEVNRLLHAVTWVRQALPSFSLQRTIVRQMIPRNPQIDRPIAQTCLIMKSSDFYNHEQTLVLYLPDVSKLEELPWYHPGVQSLAYLHTWSQRPATPDSPDSAISLGSDSPQGSVSIHYRLFPSQALPLPDRVMRTAHHLLAAVYKHGQGRFTGYEKRVHHDQIISQQRVQNTYAILKLKYAKQYCDNWVEATEPSKHVFEDLSIAAFLIELWKDMYQPPTRGKSTRSPSSPTKSPPSPLISNTTPPLTPPSAPKLPPFPGFVDIGCGNGLLVEILLQSGYPGWGFDARRRKTWSVLSPLAQQNLRELILIPQPLLDEPPSSSPPPSPNRLSRMITSLSLSKCLYDLPGFPRRKWHNGIFPKGIFIISNHADELTPWTPLLATLSTSPFLAIPCCSHTLAGERFRAPTVFNSRSADDQAPTFFAKNVKKSKSIPITIDPNPENEEFDGEGGEECTCPQCYTPEPLSSKLPGHTTAAETGDLKTLSRPARAKRPSAYSSLCDWVTHLASSVGYVVERDMLRIPSTRNVGIVGRSWVSTGDDGYEQPRRLEKVKQIVDREGANGKTWIERCETLQKPGKKGHDVEGAH